RPPGHGSPQRSHRRFGCNEEKHVGDVTPTALDRRLPIKEPRQRIAEAASRPGDAESRPWMACGGESDMDVCRAEEHPPGGTPLFPEPAYEPHPCLDAPRPGPARKMRPAPLARGYRESGGIGRRPG